MTMDLLRSIASTRLPKSITSPEDTGMLTVNDPVGDPFCTKNNVTKSFVVVEYNGGVALLLNLTIATL